MHLILVSNRLATAKTVTITPRLVALAASGFVALVIAAALLFSWLTVHFRLPFAQDLVLSVQRQETEKSEAFVRQNLNVMASRLGDMQAQLMHLDSLSERLSVLAGMKPADKAELLPPPTKGGQGGPLLPAFLQPSSGISSESLQRDLDRLEATVEQRSDLIRALESQLMDLRIKQSLLPTALPIRGHGIGSGFGVRTDPIAGVSAMHEGIDFVADVGTGVAAAAGGIVLSAEFHPQYGNLIEIDHGNDFSTRYAHLSKVMVKPGQVVKRGQPIAFSGNTGRSTGPHLHFEVRYRGVAQNPSRFLQPGIQVAQALAKR